MKLLTFAAALLAILSFQTHAAVSPIRLDIEQHSSSKAPKAKAGQQSRSNIAQHRSLTIKLSNNSAETFDSLVVKYWFIGHDLTDKKLKVFQQGQRKSALAPRGSDTVESEEAVNIYTEAHSEVSKSKGGKSKSKGKQPTVTKVPASGKKVIGYAVQVLNGTKIEAEEYSEPSYKQIAASAPGNEPSLLPKTADKKKTPKKK